MGSGALMKRRVVDAARRRYLRLEVALVALRAAGALFDRAFVVTFFGRATGLDVRDFFKVDTLFPTTFAAFFAVRTVPAETSVFPLAARFPMIVPATAPTTAPSGPASALPTTAPVTPPAVCLETGKLVSERGEERLVF